MRNRTNRLKNPDINFTADVKLGELYFEKVPETETSFYGNTERETVSGTERENLPERVQPGVTYRNARVRLQIASKLADNDPHLREIVKEE